MEWQTRYFEGVVSLARVRSSRIVLTIRKLTSSLNGLKFFLHSIIQRKELAYASSFCLVGEFGIECHFFKWTCIDDWIVFQAQCF